MRNHCSSLYRVSGQVLKSWICVLIAGFLIGVFQSVGHATEMETDVLKETAPKDESGIEEKLGVKILSLRLSANGNMLDFRYRVVDPEQSLPLFDRKNKPYLIDQASGVKCLVPTPAKIGSLRQKPRKPEPNKNYFILFGNPGKLIKQGNKVTVVIGDFKAENLVVE